MINIFGLGIAMAVVILIAVFVSFDLSFDKFHPNHENVYRHTVELIDSEWNSAKSFPGYGPYLLENHVQIEDFTRIYPTPEIGSTVKPFPEQDEKYVEKKMYYADKNLFDFFYFKLLSGNPDRLLHGPNQLMLSTELAEKYFGFRWKEENLLGHTLTITNYGNTDTKQYTLTGIFEKNPNSHFRPDALMSIASLPKVKLDLLDHFDWADAYTYLRLQPGTNPIQLKEEMDSILFQIAWGQYWEFDSKVQQLSEIHHISSYKDDMEAGSDFRLNYFLIGVAIFIMICAWVNFINMAIAKSLKRAKEVGVRKTLGALRGNIVFQFLFEGFWLNLVSGMLAILLAFLGMTLLEIRELDSQEGWPLQLWINGTPYISYFVLFLILLILMGTLISGLYPALMLSSYHPIQVLRGLKIKQVGSLSLRQSLLTFQFVISALLMIGIFTAATQLNFMLSKDLGFEKEQKLVVSSAVDDINSVDNYLLRAQNFKQELHTLPGIDELTSASSVPGKPPGGELVLCKYNGFPENVSGTDLMYNEGPTEGIVAGENFMEFYNIELATGRWFPPQAFNDTTLANKYLLVNEKFATANGFDPIESVIGKTVYVTHYAKNEPYFEGREIIGVVKNHHHFSVKEEFRPLVFSPEGSTLHNKIVDYKVPHHGSMRFFTLKIPLGENPQQQMQKVIAQVENVWQQHFSELAFEYFFLDDAFDSQYKTDIQVSRLFGAFGALSIFISCLGLFGLSSYLIQQRTKEIGIRKVLGASLKNLFSLLSANYIKLVLLASLISIPLAWWVIQRWLESYVFRIEVEWWFFAIPLLALLLISLATISYKILKTSSANPVEALRYE